MLSSPEHVCCPLSLDYQQLLGGWDLLKCYMALSAKGDLKHWGWSPSSFSSLCHHHHVRDVADKDFITAFREEQGAQYSNLEGARSIDFGCFGQVLLEIYSKFLSRQSVIFWYDSWWIKRAWTDFLNFSLDYRLFLDPHLCRPYTPTSPLPPQLLPFPSPPSLSFYG